MTPSDTPEDGEPEEADGELVDDDETLVNPHERDWPKPWMPAFLLSLSRLPNVGAAANTARVARKTVYRHRDKNVDFAEAWDESIQIAQDGIRRVLMSWATTGVPTKSVTTRTRRKTASHPDKERAAQGELIVIEETTETVETVGAERSAALLMFALRAMLPEEFDRPQRFGLGQDPDAGAIRIESVSEIDRQIAVLGAELELLDRHKPVEPDAPREITHQ